MANDIVDALADQHASRVIFFCIGFFLGGLAVAVDTFIARRRAARDSERRRAADELGLRYAPTLHVNCACDSSEAEAALSETLEQVGRARSGFIRCKTEDVSRGAFGPLPEYGTSSERVREAPGEVVEPTPARLFINGLFACDVVDFTFRYHDREQTQGKTVLASGATLRIFDRSEEIFRELSGNRLSTVDGCKACGSSLKPSARFCQRCGVYQ